MKTSFGEVKMRSKWVKSEQTGPRHLKNSLVFNGRTRQTSKSGSRGSSPLWSDRKKVLDKSKNCVKVTI